MFLMLLGIQLDALVELELEELELELELELEPVEMLVPE